MEKVSFIGKLVLLNSATSDDAEPTPGYMLPEICQITYLSGSQNEDLIDFLDDRLMKRSCYVKSKVLQIMKYLVNNGHPNFQQGLRKRSQRIAEATKCSGPPHPLHGNALYIQVRQKANELLDVLFKISENDSSPSVSLSSAVNTHACGMGSSGARKFEGFGNSVLGPEKSVGDSIIDGLRDLALRVVDPASDPRKDVTFGPSNSNIMPGYKPAAIPSTEPILDEVVQSSSQSVRDSAPDAQRLHVNAMHPKRHVRGVAGGGWDSNGDPQPNILSSRFIENVSEGHCSGESSISLDKCESEIVRYDSSIEMQLVGGIVNDVSKGPILPREDIKVFICNCARVNCEKVVELICHSWEPTEVARTMRSLLLLEALLRSDLLTPEFIVTTCAQSLVNLYVNPSVDYAVRQKARKVAGILKKLAPNQSELFPNAENIVSAVKEPLSKDAVSNNTTAYINQLLDNDTTANNNSLTESSVFPFLSVNS